MNTPFIPWLTVLLTLPLAAAALIWLVDVRRARWLALAAGILSLLVSLLVLAQFDAASSQFQFIASSPWIPTLNSHLTLGVDGISLLFLPLTNLLFAGVVLASWNSVHTMRRLYFSLLLLLQTATLGIFMALDTLLFFLFWELTLIPIYFLVSLWGKGPNRRYAAVKYTLFMLAGGVPLLFAFVLLALYAAEGHVPADLGFSYIQLLNTPLPIELQTTLFFLFLLGFGAKAPLFPFHTWLPPIAMEGPAAMAAIMTGLKLGVYGMIRFMLPLAPDAALEFQWLLMALGTAGILYGAVIALTQTNLRTMLAWSSISHVGLVVLGLAAFNIQGIQGALFQLLNFSLISGGLFLLTGMLHQRTGSTDSQSLGGVAMNMPLLTAFFFLFGLASMGVPGTNGFAAEHLLLLGALQAHTGTGLAALIGMVLGAAYFIGLYRCAFLGEARSVVVLNAVDLQGRELWIAGVMAVMILVAGIYPESVLHFIRSSSESWLIHLHS
ncbi:MAG: NADH-quinone oxidoreductase subunit [Pseudomonadota bacterium]|nr:NADH-quinone oxidoreductase subunit [Pseudomonadota bacterium]